MQEIKKIGIITSGGDCGGLNAVLKGAARSAEHFGIEADIISNGYAGLYNLVEVAPIEIDGKIADRIYSGTAGSEAGHSRVKIKKIKDPNKYERIKEGLKKHQIDALVIAGGDDTGSVVVDLIENGIRCIHCPKTMDLDLQTYSVGGDSTINRISRFTRDLRTTGLTHNRALVIEVFGRYAGHTAFRGGLGADADCILIPEIPVDYDVVYEHFKKTYIERLLRSAVRAATYIIVAAEGLTNKDGKHFSDSSSGTDAFGHVRLSGAGEYVQNQIRQRMADDSDWEEIMKKEGLFVEGIYEKPEIRHVTPGHLVRAGDSTSYDVSFGKQIGAGAVMLLRQGITGVTVAGFENGDIQYMPTKDAIKPRPVDKRTVSLFETQGVCFGRVPTEINPGFKLQNGNIQRYM